jgi:hypothetical protein
MRELTMTEVGFVTGGQMASPYDVPFSAEIGSMANDSTIIGSVGVGPGYNVNPDGSNGNPIRNG